MRNVRHQFENSDYYVRFSMADELTDKPCPFTIQNFIKITIFPKMMALHDNLVCDSENWCAYKTWFVLSCGVLFYSCVWEQLYRDKGLLAITASTVHVILLPEVACLNWEAKGWVQRKKQLYGNTVPWPAVQAEERQHKVAGRLLISPVCAHWSCNRGFSRRPC